MSGQKVEQAIALVKELILSGHVRPGDRLPKEADLAAQLGVSRNSLREAVRAMQTVRILEARQGDGTYVSNLDPAGMMDVLSYAVDVSDARAVRWYLELRQILEVAAVQETAIRRTEAELEALRTVHQAALVERDPTRLMELDRDFHNLIAEIGGNPVHAALSRVVSAPTMRARIWRLRLADRDYATMLREHQRILDAIEHRLVDEARHAMWGHLHGVIAWVRSNGDALAGPSLMQ